MSLSGIRLAVITLMFSEALQGGGGGISFLKRFRSSTFC